MSAASSYGLIVKQFYGVGFEEIVTVEVLYIFALCGFYSRFTGVGKSLVGFVDDDDARVFVGISGDDFRRVVGTAVVDDNDFYVGGMSGRRPSRDIFRVVYRRCRRV